MRAQLAIVALSAWFGIAGGEWASGSRALRDRLGIWCGRGHLIAIADGKGVYERDVDRALKEFCGAAGIDLNDPSAIKDKQSIVPSLLADLVIAGRARHETIRGDELAHEFASLRVQFRSDRDWQKALASSSLSVDSLRRMLREQLRAQRWIARHAQTSAVTEEECRSFYRTHADEFFEPERLCASQLFLAAPPETPTDEVERKSIAIESLAVRIDRGENFAGLVAQNSEDEATRFNGGDVGCFTAARMPPDFVAAAALLRPGEIGEPVRTRLGFHIIRLNSVQPARQRSFEEARADIEGRIAEEKRVLAVQELKAELDAAGHTPL